MLHIYRLSLHCDKGREAYVVNNSFAEAMKFCRGEFRSGLYLTNHSCIMQGCCEVRVLCGAQNDSSLHICTAIATQIVPSSCISHACHACSVLRFCTEICLSAALRRECVATGCHLSALPGAAADCGCPHCRPLLPLQASALRMAVSPVAVTVFL